VLLFILFIWDRYVHWFLDLGYSVLVFDFYGHGYSDNCNLLSIDTYVEQFEQLLEYLNIPKQYSSFLLVGHSMGGLIGSKFTSTSRYKELVSTLILINCAGIAVQMSMQTLVPSILLHGQNIIRKTRLFDGIVYCVGHFLKWNGDIYPLTHDEISLLALSLDESENNLNFWHKYSPKLVSDIVRSTKSISFLYQSWIHQSSLRNRADVFLSVSRGCLLLDGDYSKNFSSIDVPTLIIWGKDDTLLPKIFANNLNEFIPHAEVLIVDGDHGAFLQKPKEIFNSILNFNSYGILKETELV